MSPLLQFKAAATALIQRYQMARSAGMSFGGRRDTWTVLGYPEMDGLSVRDFLDRYERGGVAGRVVDVLPDGTWRGEMWLQEDEDPEKVTPFEQAWEDMEKRLAIRQRFHQTDVLSRLSTYAILLIGTADGELDKELPKGNADQLLYLQPYLGSGGPSNGRPRGGFQGEAEVSIAEYDLDTKSPRFAMPLFYTLRRPDIAVDMFQKPIHWSRVVHVAEGTLRDDTFGRPALERVWNHLEDLDKVVGGGSEAFWLRSNAGIHLNVDPTMQLNASGQEELKKLAEQAEEYQHQLTRMIRTRGVEINQLGSDVANFQSPADVIITLIAGSCGIPKRLLVGSERGELASTQDRENFRDLINGRQANFAGPKIVRQLVDRLIEYGYLPAPKEYKVMWPTIEVMSETEKAQGATGWAGVNSSMQKTVFTEDEIRDKWAGLKPLTEEQKKAIEEESAKKLADQQALMASKNPPPGEEDAKDGKKKPAPGDQIAPSSKGPSVDEEPKAAEEYADDELVRVLQSALETGADDVVAAIVGLGGPGSGRYPKGSGDQNAGGGGGSSSSGSAGASRTQAIAKSLKNDVEGEMRGRDRYRDIQSDEVAAAPYGGSGHDFAVRDFGAWETPPDVTGSDREDYDWQQPTKETVAKLDKIVDRWQTKHPDLKITWSAEEKNWVSFHVRDKSMKTLGGPGSGRYPKGSGRQSVSAGFVKGTKAQAKALGLPPAWKNVMINPDPKGDLLATGEDKAGRTQYRYSARHTEEASAAKHGRVAAFGKALPGLRKQIDSDYETKGEAVVADLIDKTSFRRGSDRDTKAKVKAYGASTLEGRHVKITGDRIDFEFVAKKGTTVHKSITDARMAKELKRRKAEAGPDGKLFPDTNDKKVADYVKANAPGFTPKDFRTWNATREAMVVMKKMPAPKTKSEFQRARKEVGARVGATLGHTEKGGGNIALKSYISPSVFAKWEAKL